MSSRKLSVYYEPETGKNFSSATKSCNETIIENNCVICIIES